VGVGLPIDGKILFDAIGDGLVIRNLVDIGLMTKYSRVELYLDQDQSPLGLERCVQDVLQRKMDKSLQRSDWRGELTAEQQKCEFTVLRRCGEYRSDYTQTQG
jgi:ribonuclease D